MGRLRVAVGEQLKRCPRVITLGVRPQMTDYTAHERRLLRRADIIFHPTSRFVDHLSVLGKETFPSLNCYRLLEHRLKQISLLRLLNVTYPRTRVYYGDRQKRNILKDFGFPFIAKKIVNSASRWSNFLVGNEEKLKWYNNKYNPAFIQEYIRADQVFLVIIFNYDTILGYWQRADGGNLERRPVQSIQGGRESEVVDLATKIARGGRLSDLAVEIVFDGRQLWVSEMYFHYEEMGELQIGKERVELIMEMIERGEL